MEWSGADPTPPYTRTHPHTQNGDSHAAPRVDLTPAHPAPTPPARTETAMRRLEWT
jgi:hypothetical protein